MAQNKKVTGIIWNGFVEECKCRMPFYIINEKEFINKEFGDGVFLCDILKKFVNKNVSIEIKEI